MHASFPAPAGFRIVSSEEVRDGQGAPARVIHPDPGLRITLEPERAMQRDWYQFELKFPPEGLVHVVARLSLAGEGVCGCGCRSWRATIFSPTSASSRRSKASR